MFGESPRFNAKSEDSIYTNERSPGPVYNSDDAVLSTAKHRNNTHSVKIMPDKVPFKGTKTEEGNEPSPDDPRFNSDDANRSSWVYGSFKPNGTSYQTTPLSAGPARYSPNLSQVKPRKNNATIGNTKRFLPQTVHNYGKEHERSSLSLEGPGPVYNISNKQDIGRSKAPGFSFSGSATKAVNPKRTVLMAEDLEDHHERSSWISAGQHYGINYHYRAHQKDGPAALGMDDRVKIESYIKPGLARAHFGSTDRFGHRNRKPGNGRKGVHQNEAQWSPRVEYLSSDHTHENLGTSSPGPAKYSPSLSDKPKTSGGSFANPSRVQAMKSLEPAASSNGDDVSHDNTRFDHSRCTWLKSAVQKSGTGVEVYSTRRECGPGPGAYTLPSSFASANFTHNKKAALRKPRAATAKSTKKPGRRPRTSGPAKGSRGPVLSQNN